MSAGPHIFAPLSPAAVADVPAADPPDGPLAEMQSLRLFVSERLAAAVEDILGVFGETVVRYRKLIERQRQQLDRLRGEEEPGWGPQTGPDRRPDSSWIKRHPDDQSPSVPPVHTDGRRDEPGAGSSDARVKTEVSGRSGPAHLDPAAQLLAEHQETDESEDRSRVPATLWTPEETGETDTAGLSRRTRSAGEPGLGCQVCGELFQRKKHLLKHAAAHLRDCSVCGKHLEHPEKLQRHLQGHRDVLFPCGVCGQAFTLRNNLQMHMRIHSGERPYGCTLCSKSFGRKATLVRHVRSHTGEKPFACSVCGRGFVEKGNLTVHMRTHTGERPYRCSACDRRFSQLSCYNKHRCQRERLTSDLGS